MVFLYGFSGQNLRNRTGSPTTTMLARREAGLRSPKVLQVRALPLKLWLRQSRARREDGMPRFAVVMQVRVPFAVALLLLTANAAGHHSPATFDQQRDIVLEGRVQSFEWANPHVYLRVAVRGESGEEVLWAIEAQSPRVMSMFGWSPVSLEPGENVIVEGHPARNAGDPVALGRAVRKEDGTTLKISWQRDEIREALRQNPTTTGPP